MLNKALRVLKSTFLPHGATFRKILFGPAAGIAVKIDLQNQTKLYLGLYELELNRYFRALVTPGTKCFDVGGAHGYNALMLARMSGAPVLSVECEDALYEELCEARLRNPYPISTLKAKIGKSNRDGERSLDAIAKETFLPDFIKIDIEGGEANALLGASWILETRGPSLIIEVHGREQEVACLDILNRFGYSPKVVDQRGWLREYRPLSHNRWLVCTQLRNKASNGSR
jgi:hypothetical protein